MNAHGKPKLMYFVDTNAMGGGEKYVADLIAALAGRYEILLLCADFPPFVEFIRRKAGPLCRIVPLKLPSVTRNRAAQAGLSALRGGKRRFGFLRAAGQAVVYWNTWTCYRRIRAALKAERPDVLHVSNGGYPAAESHRAAVLAARSLGVPRRVMTVHNMADPLPPLAAPERFLDRRVEKSLDAVIAVSTRSKESLAERRGFAAEGISVIVNGFRPEESSADAEALRRDLGVPPGRRVIGNIGGLQPRKGHAVLVEAFAKIHWAAPDAFLVIVGQGECRADLEKQVARLGLEGAVSLAGFRPDAGRYMRALDVFVFPSIAYESFPYVMLEAMDAALPIVATRVGGTAEQISDGVSGRLVAPEDPDALAAAVLDIFSDPGRAARWGAAARLRVREEFSLEKMVEKTEAFYR